MKETAGKKRGRRRPIPSRAEEAAAPHKAMDHDNNEIRNSAVGPLHAQATTIKATDRSTCSFVISPARGDQTTPSQLRLPPQFDGGGDVDSMLVDLGSPAETVLASSHQFISPAPRETLLSADTACSKPLHRTLEDLEKRWSGQKQQQQQQHHRGRGIGGKNSIGHRGEEKSGAAAAAAGWEAAEWALATNKKRDSETSCPTTTDQSLEDTARVDTTGKRRTRNSIAQSHRAEARRTVMPAKPATTRSTTVPGVIDVQLNRSSDSKQTGAGRSARPAKEMSVFERLSQQSTASSRRKRIREMSRSRSTQSLMTPRNAPPTKSFDTASLSTTISCADSVFDRLYRNQKRGRKFPHVTPGSTDSCAKPLPDVDEADIDAFSAAQARVERRLTYTPKMSKRRSLTSARSNKSPRHEITPDRSANQVFDRLNQDSARAQANRARTQVEGLAEHPIGEITYICDEEQADERKKMFPSTKVGQRPKRTGVSDVRRNFQDLSTQEVSSLPTDTHIDRFPALNQLDEDISCIDEAESTVVVDQIISDDDEDDEARDRLLNDTKLLIDDSMDLIDNFLDVTNQLIEELIEEAEISAIAERAENTTFAAIEEAILAEYVAAREEQQSILLIQKHWRGYLARREFVSLRLKTTVVPSLMQSALSAKSHSESRCNMISSYYLREGNGLEEAVPLQRLWRENGRSERQLQTQGAQVVKIQNAIRGYIQSLHYLSMKESSIILQGIVRGFIVRKRLRRMAYAASVIQTILRCYRARRAFGEAIRSVVILQAWGRGVLISSSVSSQARAARTIQSAWRGNAARQEKIGYGQACVHVQTSWRAYQARRSYVSSRSSAILLQSMARQLIARSRYENHLLLKAGTIVAIQSRARGMLARQQLKAIHDAAICIQRVWRGRACRVATEKKKRRRIEEVTLIIQSRLRGLRDRRAFTASIRSVMILQRWTRGVLTSRSADRQVRAAEMIQVAWRDFIAGRQKRTYVQACVVVQTSWRAHRFRCAYASSISSAIILQSMARRLTARAGYKQMTKVRAVVAIQRRARGICVRNMLQSMQNAVLCIQREWRARVARGIYRGIVHNVVVLQTAYRTYRTKQDAKERRATQATVIIQRSIRRYRIHRAFMASIRSVIILQAWSRRALAHGMIVKQSRAAMTVQSSWRRTVVRREAKVLLREKRMNQDASIIQSRARVYLARNSFATSIHSVVILQAWIRGVLTSRMMLRQAQAASMIQRRWRAYRARLYFATSFRSVLILQAWARGFVTSKMIEKQSRSAETLQCAWRAYVARSQTKSSVRLQTSWRAYQARRSFLSSKSSAILLQAVARRRVAMLRHGEHTAKVRAIVLIQRWARGIDARRRLQAMYKASVCIQRAWQAHASRRQLQSATKIQSLVRMYKVKSSVAERKRAATTINSCTRVILARKHVRTFRTAAIMIQSSWRGASSRRFGTRRLIAALTIQSSFRRHYCELWYWTLQRRIILLQASARGLVKRITLRRRVHAASIIQQVWKDHCLIGHSRLVVVVIKIQSMLRAHFCQRLYNTKKTAAIAIQSSVRQRRARGQAKRIQNAAIRVARAESSATLIQSSYRSYCERATFVKKLRCAVVLQAWVRKANAKVTYSDLLRNVGIIQALIRRRLAQKRFTLSRNCAIVIQSYWRAYSRKLAKIEERRRMAHAADRDQRIASLIRAQVDDDVQLILDRDANAIRSFGPCVRQLTKQLYVSQARAAAPIKGPFCSRLALTVDGELKLKGGTYTSNSVSILTGCESHNKTHEDVVTSALKPTVQESISACVAIQRAYRVHQAITSARAAEWNAAVTIQSTIRGRRDRRLLSASIRAIVIRQAWSRRLLLTSRKMKIQAEAVEILQSAWRGYVARSYVLVYVQACTDVQRSWRGYQARYSSISTRAAKTMQRSWRRYVVRRDAQAYVHACLRVQNCWRVYRAQRVCIFKRAAKMIQTAWRRYAATQEKIVYVQACIHVQTSWRTHLAQRAYVSSRSSAIILQSMARQLIARARYQDYIAKTRAVTVLQGRVRRLLVQRNLEANQVAATYIQRAWRGHLRRVAAEKKRKKMRRRRVMTRRRRVAACVIQSRWRGHHARRAFGKSIRSVVILQAWVRGVFTSHVLEKQSDAAKTTQSAWRGYAVRQEKIACVQACEVVQTSWRAYRARRPYVSSRSSAILLQSVVAIQGWARGIHARRKLKKMNVAAVCIERAWRFKMLQEIGSVVALGHLLRAQSFARMIIVRQRLLRANEAARCIQVHYLTWKMHWMTVAVEWAALTIQRAVRCHLLYVPALTLDDREYEHIHSAVLIIQRFARCVLAKRKDRSRFEAEKSSPWSSTFARFFGYSIYTRE